MPYRIRFVMLLSTLRPANKICSFRQTSHTQNVDTTRKQHVTVQIMKEMDII